MARRKKRTAKAKIPRLNLPVNAIREIIAIILITLAVFLSVAIIGWAGSLGIGALSFVKFLFGLASLILPVAFLIIAWILFQPDKYEFKLNNLLGIIGFFVFSAGIIELITATTTSFDIRVISEHGGIIGFGLARIMLPILTKPLAIFILSALVLISLIIASNTSLKDLLKAILAGIVRPKPKEDINIKEQGMSINTKLPIRGTIGRGRIEQEDKEIEVLTVNRDKDWKYPPLDLLESMTTKADAGNVKENAAIIQNTLENFGIDVGMGDVSIGPTVAQYTLKPSSGVKLNKITTLDRDLALALAAHPIRIEAPIPGKSLVGVEVPNKKIATVRLKDILSSKEMEQYKSNLSFILGRDVSGEIVAADLAKMPHLLIAGATGSGKSVMINSLILSLLYRNSPSELKLIMVDQKRVELTPYNKIPHLLTPVITEIDKTLSALKWVVAEMERRYRLFSNVSSKGIADYNRQNQKDAMPHIVVLIDELNELMMVAGKDLEALVVRLAQTGRAAGVHLVLSTQRPDVNVITGLIKANVPARIALTTTSQVDSRTIIDQAGAEKLLSRGDMLFLSPEFTKPKRIQGVFLSDKEVRAVIDFLIRQREPQYNEEVTSQPVRIAGHHGIGLESADDDMYEEAAEIVIQSGKASASLLQRRLRIGYARAARLIDLLEERGVVGPADGARPRELLVSSVTELPEDRDEFE
ncbi:MAG: DNA translocase FtsK 4TM domain-containing protein [bacterium]|nr:DNA translocase FtsK 4TM domain-containing protein [bacterium]